MFVHVFGNSHHVYVNYNGDLKEEEFLSHDRSTVIALTKTTTATKTPQICIFDNEKQYLCTLCTCIFHFLTF